MSNKIMKFFSEKFGAVRGRYIDGECWFVGKDVAQALGYKLPQKALRDHVFDNYKQVLNAKSIQQKASQSKGSEMEHLETTSPRGLIYVKEAGLYQLIFSSKLPEAVEFQCWVFEEVLPKMRREALWEEARAEGKRVHRELTDAIKSFIEYLEARGELDRAEVAWYSAFSNLVNKVTDTKDKRDDLPMLSVLRLSDCENILIHGIEEGMAAGKGHHDIWVACNEKLNAWRQLTK